MKIKNSYNAILLASFTLFGCSSNESVNEASVSSIPKWILNPQIENGIATSDCVLFSGNISIDRKQAIAQARVQLSAEIESRVAGLDETYQDKIQINGESTSGSSFSSVSKQLTEQTLVGSQTVKTDIIDISGKDNVCVMVAIKEGGTQELYNNLIKASNKKLSPDDEEVLYTEFKASRAKERLNDALGNQ